MNFCKDLAAQHLFQHSQLPVSRAVAATLALRPADDCDGWPDSESVKITVAHGHLEAAVLHQGKSNDYRRMIFRMPSQN
jgi:hypothetical protein